VRLVPHGLGQAVHVVEGFMVSTPSRGAPNSNSGLNFF
jgi:hypothetical protein